MRYALFLLTLFLAAPAWAAPWLALKPVALSASGSPATISVDKKTGPVSALRLRIDGATVHLDSLVLIPIKGDPIPLHVPQILKTGESSGLIRIPGTAVPTAKLRLGYRVSGGKKAVLSVRLKTAGAPQNGTITYPQSDDTITYPQSGGPELIRPILPVEQ